MTKWLFLLLTCHISVISLAWADSKTAGIPVGSADSRRTTYPTTVSGSMGTITRVTPTEAPKRGSSGGERLTPKQRDRMKQRFKQWEQLPDKKKNRIRQRFKQFQNLPQEKRQALRQQRRWFKSLPPEQRQELRQKWKNLSPQQRQKLRQDRGIGRANKGKLKSRSPRRHRVR